MTAGLSDVRLHLVDSIEEAQNFLRWAGERRPHNAIAVDIETGEKPGNPLKDALSPWHGDIRLVQVGDAKTGWAIPWAEWSGVFYEMINKHDGPIVCHNIAFEAQWFAVKSRWEMPWHQAHDTMIMAQVLNPLGTGALKKLAAEYIDRRSVALQDTLKDQFSENGWTWGTVPITFEPYWAYGALDTVLTMKIWEQFYDKCGPGKQYSVPYELEMSARRIATRMEINGARVDLDYSKSKMESLTRYTQGVKDWAKAEYGGLSITSNVQLVRAFEKMGAVITRTTPSGQKSIDKEQLDLLVRDGTPEIQYLAEVVLKQKKADKLASTYFSNFLSSNIDGVLHPSIRTMGARTGRMSIRDPALQTLPSGDPTVRRAFIPKDEDHVIIASDLDQVEFRLTANFSGDMSLIDLFHEADATKGDVFTSIMQQMYQDNTLVKADPRRKLVKSTVYGKLYGAGIDKMALTSGVQTEVMREVVESFDRAYPGVKQLQRSIEDVGMRRLKSEGQGYVNTRTGRRLPCDDDRVYSLTNYLIQATAAEVFKMNLIKLDQADLTELMIVPVHDEIVMQAPKEDAEEIMHIVQDCMTTRDGWEVPLTSGVDGPFENWGQKYEE
ncbi:MAG: DNA polymerase [Cetobacterium sp.]